MKLPFLSFSHTLKYKSSIGILRYPALKESIEREQAAVWSNLKDENKEDVKTSGSFGGRNTYGPLLVMLKADKQAVLVRREMATYSPGLAD